ncbi:MAG: NAD(P)H-dependent oxidoreductase subunit E [Nitrospirota bacterium]|nr:NAD(P)H-dependent oxidoreductase subunit E [Nitrospirota bacterium]
MESRLRELIERHRETGGNIISLLQDTQEAFGYIPRDAVMLFSRELGIAASRFYGVATFYAQFRLKPVGRHKVTACCGTACHVRGADRIISGIQRELHLAGEQDTTDDGLITLDKVACLGFCSFAPVVLVDGAVHGKATTDIAIREIKNLRKKI